MKKNHKIGSVMVVGAGIAGIQASIDLADSGYKVYLVESGSAIGGRMAQLDKTFPTNDCAMCTISPRLVAAGTHRNIEIITNAELTELSGDAGNFNAKITIKPHFVDLEKCNGCGVCAENCPVSLKDEYDQRLSDRKAIFKEYPQAVPNKFAMTREGVAPCYDACPIHGNPSGYVALTAAGKYEEAFVSAAENNPFPSICGRICEHPCEQSCNRTNIDSPISIAYIKRFLSDWHAEYGKKLSPEEKQASIKENGKKAAIVGSGPAGLTAALDLRKMGYDVTVFEKHGVLGGMMRIGIPAFRLPVEVIEKDIQDILDYGIKVKLNSPLTSETDIESLFKDGFEAVFLAVGSHKSITMGIPGEDNENVMSGVDFLREVRLGKRKTISGTVAVIGGGNAAVDVARTSLRLGAHEVKLLYRRTRAEMPAIADEVQAALEEGVSLQTLKMPKRILPSEGKLKVECVRMELGEIDESGRRRPVEIPGSEHIIEVDSLILGIGQKPALDFLREGGKLRLNHWGTVSVDEKTGMTSWAGVFSGGDVIRGAANVVQAIADGHHAAKAMDAYIKGQEYEPEELDEHIVELSVEELKARKEKVLTRQEMPVIGLNRRRTFEEVDLGFTEEMAKAEAERCLFCAVCSWCGLCEKVCEPNAILYNEVPKEQLLNIGAIILAPGHELYDAEKKGEYGYRRFANVVSGLDYERILSASGPFAGHIQRLSDGAEPKKIAFIQCVGSRDKDNPYCSSVCCMYATKQAIVTKEHLPDIECKIFVMDVRAFGKGFDEYYERAKEKYNVKYIYTRPSNIIQDFNTHNLSLQFTEDGKNWVEEEFDMVVLSSGLCSTKYAKKLADVCSIELNEYNFAKSSYFAPTVSSKEGIYLAGTFESPKDIPESVVQASGAAAGAMELLADVRGTQVEDKKYPPEKDITGQEPRIGVFVCHCGSNIGGVIDCEKVAEYARGLDGVAFATNMMYSCSPDGLKTIKESIEEYNLNKVVVASCTPRTHEPLFQETIREVGLNPYLFEMANIRDQCTWVHARLGNATEGKAIDLVKMAVARARTIEALTTKSYIPKRSVVIVGAGVAGMTAALSVANQGFEVNLIEKTGELGGNLVKIKKTIEGLKPLELLKDLETQIANHKRITVYKNSIVTECKGFIGDFKSKVNCNGEEIEIEHGAAIIATGANESKPEEYLYGQNDKVLTQMELEEQLESNPEKAKQLNEVVMIQCVGSREPGRMICSRVCCAEAIKNAITIKSINPKATVAILYRDVRTYGFMEEYYNKAREMGILFFRYDLDGKPVVSQNKSGQLEVDVKDLNSMLDLSFSPDAVVLSAAMIPSEDCESVSTAFKVPLNLECFFLEAHMKLRPVDFASDGLFLCGTCHSPKFIDEAITQAKATAAKAVSILSRKEMEISGVVSVVDPDKCAACLTCVRTCPYDVPKINEDGVAEIEAAMCHGCGICASECPAKAIQLMHYKDSQIIAKTKALFSKEDELVRNE
ncbi:MAG: FAD-dependent oxidoreductase [Planctomycetes bacterium]|nr:FAD-dependent oxidoreductase [Planctomycetota bacterium]